ncbi:MAG: ABC transporter permease [Chloroflexi bacterium]|nr:ABC transporter permease [Chloroflexota bacterium]
MKRSLPDILHFLFADLRHDHVRALLILLGFSTVFSCFFILGSLANSMAEFYETQALGRNLIVIEADFINPTDATMDPSVSKAIQALPNEQIEKISPIIFRYLRVNDRLVILRSAPLEDWESIYHLSLVSGDWPKTFGEVAVGEGTAEAYQWKIGSSIKIYGSEFEISGILRAQGTAFSSIWMPFEQGMDLFGKNRSYQALYVKAAVYADSDTLRGQLQELDEIDGRYLVFFEDTYSKRLNQLLRDITALTRIAEYLSLLGIIFGTYTSTSLSLTERARELGVLRSLGISHQELAWLFSFRSLIIGWFGFLFAIGTTWLFVYFQNVQSPLFVWGYPILFKLEPEQFLTGFFASSWMIVIGSLISARRFFRMPVRDLLSEINL